MILLAEIIGILAVVLGFCFALMYFDLHGLPWGRR